MLLCCLSAACFSDPADVDDTGATDESGSTTTTDTTSSTSATSTSSSTTASTTTAPMTSSSTSTGMSSTDDEPATSSTTADTSSGSDSGTTLVTGRTDTSSSSSSGGNPLEECEAFGFGFPSGAWVSGAPAEVCFGSGVSEEDVAFEIEGVDLETVQFAPDQAGPCVARYTWTLTRAPIIMSPIGAEVEIAFLAGGGGVEVARCAVVIQ